MKKSKIIEAILSKHNVEDRTQYQCLVPPFKVADSPTVWMVSDDQNAPTAVCMVASPQFPQSVSRAARNAHQAKDALPEEGKKSVLVPDQFGEIEGRSYAIYPFCQTLSQFPLWRWVEKRKLCPTMLQWLLIVLNSTKVHQEETKHHYHTCLEAMVQCKELSDTVRRESEKAQHRLHQLRWTPFHILAHNDLWKGNVMKYHGNFVIIDWGGSEIEGYPIYDLICWSHSMQISPHRLQQEVASHCHVLRCPLEDSMSYLLAALGHILIHIEEFPMEKYLTLAEKCFHTLSPIAMRT